ncbi:MAG: bifunctional phosphoribosylaminoimidazolecarboxamide formyltransferase/IMP cyclohydrolase PurH [Bacteroidetes bacterium HGW-Bacteroidetes-15]|nr:MAG: bifunctional phosphoribosylaminoimidazolecarboxamide formyltransferase/IMP cyclohydrolase PurH [Bacteroidetes bacterium HGW-Bacteroidetes-15]
MKQISLALISVFNKNRLDEIIHLLDDLNINIISTGGTHDFILKQGVKSTTVEDLSSFPHILGGRVKTLHPTIFGGILFRRDNQEDKKQIEEYNIPPIDLVIVDLYPFEKTVLTTDDDSEIIEKIDIGGISLIRAAAKNFKDVLVIPSSAHYDELIKLLKEQKGKTSEEDRKRFAGYSFNVSSHYDTIIFNYFNKEQSIKVFKESILTSNVLRYGENPHQEGIFYGDLSTIFEQLNGKVISYNNLQDIEAATLLIDDFTATTFAILKHNNVCGLASKDTLLNAWTDALSGDPVSAFGGVLITNRELDKITAEEINKLFFEVIIAPNYNDEALKILKNKKNRIILKRKNNNRPKMQFKSLFNGVIAQERDIIVDNIDNMEVVTIKSPTKEEFSDLVFANIIVKHTKSNAIVLVKNKQLIGSGAGQTSRIDALKQAIEKAKSFGFNFNGAVMASDAFFPFADSVEIASKAGITAIVHPGGSIRDKDSIEYCNNNNISMIFTGNRHFKH